MRVLAVRCTDAEAAAITAAAAQAGMSVGSYLRQQATGSRGPRAIPRPQVDRVELARALAQLGRPASNVNQLARAANSGEIPAREELETTATALRDVCAAIMRALGRQARPRRRGH